MSIPFPETQLAIDIAASVGLIALALPLRQSLIRRACAGVTVLTGEQRARLFRIRAVSAGAVAISLGVIWFAELQSLLWSVTAIAVALVVATKELIQCGTGSLMRAAGKSFRVGDRIEIDGTYGEIVAHVLLTTTLAEIERGSAGRRPTGRTIVIPNSRLFSADVRIDLGGATLVSHRFHMIFDPSVSAHAAVEFMEKTAARLCRPIAEEVERAAGEVARRTGILQAAPAPVVTLGTTEMAKIRLDVVLSCPADEAAHLERELKMEFLEWLWAHAQARQAQAAAERFKASNDAYGRAA